jgi:hypothetical protein
MSLGMRTLSKPAVYRQPRRLRITGIPARNSAGFANNNPDRNGRLRRMRDSWLSRIAGPCAAQIMHFA